MPIPSSAGHIEWCQTVLKECEALDGLEISEVEKKAPLIFEQLVTDTSGDGEEVSEENIMRYLEEEGGMEGYLKGLRRYCLDEVEKVKDSPLIKSATLLGADEQQLFNLYEGRLDGQLSRTLKELREAQASRLNTLQGVVEPG